MAAPTLIAGGVTFTFNEGDVDAVETTIQADPQNTELAGTGPANSPGYDYGSVKKTIQIKGRLTQADTSRTSSGTVTTIDNQKQWLESILNGVQVSIKFTSTYDEFSVLGQAGATPPYQSAFGDTYVFIKSMSFNEKEGRIADLPFTLVLEVASSG